MIAVERLIKTLEQRGLKVERGAEPGQLILRGPAQERSPEVMEALKAFKPQLLEWFGREPKPQPESEEERRPYAGNAAERGSAQLKKSEASPPVPTGATSQDARTGVDDGSTRTATAQRRDNAGMRTEGH